MAGSIYAAAARRLASVSGLALTVAASGAAAQSALPTGGSVASGAASIGVNGSAMTVTQSSQRAIVNWNGFSIGQGASVNFAQPNANSAILNRVTGTTTSQIAGQLNANGQVFLVNPNGIAITRTGAVQVGGGFVASTLGLSNDDFTNGNFNFRGNGVSKGVSVDGTITTGSGGFVGLIGGTVSVSGEIVAPLGKVALGSGEAATLDLTGDNFLRVAVPSDATAADGQGLVDVSGKVKAAGGAVIVKAATAANAVRNAINIPGSLSATSARASGGSIILGGGPGGDVNVSGRIAASSVSQGGSVKIAGRNVKLNQAKIAANAKAGPGGSITITADKTVSLGSTRVSANGGTRGGAIRIGGDFHGASDIPAAQQVTVDAASVLSANAGAWGDGGTVAVWSNALTSFAGLINARGGASSGNGGYVEVSANPANHGWLSYSGLADTRAPAGVTGSLLLDPYDITISNASGNTNITTTGSTTYTSSGTGSVLSTTILDNQLATSNVTVSTGAVGSPGGEAGNITVVNDISWTPTSTATTLTLEAAGYIHLDANISASAGSFGQGSLTMTATNEIYQRGDFSITANDVSAISSAGAVVLTSTNFVQSISGSGATGFSFGSYGNINVGTTGVSAPNGSVALLSQFGGVTQTGAITGQALYAEAGGGSVDLFNHGNSVGTLAAQVTSSGTGEFVYDGTNASTSIGTVTYNRSSPRTETIVPVTSAPGISANSVFVVNYGGDLVMDAAVTSANGAGLAATGAFINNVGAGAISIGPSGQWQVFSSSPAVDKFNGLDSGNTAAWNSPIGSGGETGGNHYFFAFQPTITVTSTNVNKTYGDNATAAVAAAYTISGLQPGVAGAYLGDTAAAVYSGTPSVTSLGSPATASVAGGPYTITVAAGTFAVTDGYALALASPGAVNVSPATLTWSVADAFSTYGTTAALGAATLNGVVNGDTVNATVSAFSGATPVTLAPKTAAGTYSELVTAIDSGNYVLSPTGNTPGTLTISPLTITYAVADANSTYGTTAIPGAATLSGVLPGDTVTPTVGVFSGSTPITLVPKTPVGAYSEDVTAIDNLNYIISDGGNTSGVLTISPLAITWAVANANATYGTTAVLGATTLNGVLAGDTVTPTTEAFSGATPVTLFERTPAGTYSEQVTAITNPNYTLAANGNTPGVLTISPLAITYAVADANSTYGTTPTLGATTLNGVLEGDTVTPTTGAFSGATQVTLIPKTPVGSYSEQVYALSNPDYTIAASGNKPGLLTISPLAITYAVANANSTYGTTPLLGATTLDGVLAGDTVTPTTEAFSGATPIALTPRTPVGSYSEEVTALSNANYTLAATGNTPGVLTVSPLAITYAVANANSIFGTTPTLGATTLNGVVAGDTVTPTTGAFAGTEQVALTPSLPVGVYAERVTALSNSNYTIASTGNAPGELTVSQTAMGVLPPALINWTAPSGGGGGIDLGYFENQLSATQNSCNFGADLPDPNRFSDPKAALQALSTSMEKMFELCQNMTPSTIADALDAYAARLEVLAPRLPPQLRTLPQIIRKAAQNIRNAKTPGEAVKAVGAALVEVHKAIALLRADNPDVARAGAEASKSVDAALNAARISLLRASAI